jgi:sterol desaturase/sphingolipid hydroxylase (fatty acid hydroxylase superfamily)
MEALTHVHPVVPFVFWSPVVGWLLWRSVEIHHLRLTELAACAVAGLLVWTLSEYGLHRFLFHYPARSRVGKYLVFLFHGVHHATPRDRTRLVMPPAGAVLVMAMLYGLFGLIVPSPWIEPFCAFFIVGYLIYDYLHFAFHHLPMQSRLLYFLKTHHMRHHYGEPGLRYGVSSPLWDWVFGTYAPVGSGRRDSR